MHNRCFPSGIGRQAKHRHAGDVLAAVVNPAVSSLPNQHGSQGADHPIRRGGRRRKIRSRCGRSLHGFPVRVVVLRQAEAAPALAKIVGFSVIDIAFQNLAARPHHGTIAVHDVFFPVRIHPPQSKAELRRPVGKIALHIPPVLADTSRRPARRPAHWLPPAEKSRPRNP